jgi:phage replication O-like protein O
MDQLMKGDLTLREHRVLAAIGRMTFGWHKEFTDATADQFSEMTDIPANHIHETLKSLVKKGLVKVEGGRGHKTYRLSESTESVRSEPCESPETGLMKVPKRDEVKSQVGTKVSPKTGLSHEGHLLSTKERVLKKPVRKSAKSPAPGLQELIAAYSEEFIKRYARKPIVNWGHWGKEFKEWLADHDVETLKQAIRRFFESDDPWIVSCAHSPGALKARINALMSQAAVIQKGETDLDKLVRMSEERFNEEREFIHTATEP